MTSHFGSLHVCQTLQCDWDAKTTRLVVFLYNPDNSQAKACLYTIYKETNHLIPSNTAHLFQTNPSSGQTRRSSGHHIYRRTISSQIKTTIFIHSTVYPWPWTIPEWNILPDNTRCAPRSAIFKSQLDCISTVRLSKTMQVADRCRCMM